MYYQQYTRVCPVQTTTGQLHHIRLVLWYHRDNIVSKYEFFPRGYYLLCENADTKLPPKERLRESCLVKQTHNQSETAYEECKNMLDSCLMQTKIINYCSQMFHAIPNLTSYTESETNVR